MSIHTAGSDYHPLNQTVKFEPTDKMRSHQCLEIDISEDLLDEDWEMFSVLLSTNSSSDDINLGQSDFDVFIRPSSNGSLGIQ